MRTKEFIKRVEELGYKTLVYHKTLRIRDKGCLVALIVLNKRFIFETNFVIRPITDERLFDLIVEYARTPIEDREEEKKFYAKHRHLVDFFTYDPVYLNYDAINKKIYVYDKKQTDLIQTQFTLKEYEEIKKKFNTDLADFELVEVK